MDIFEQKKLLSRIVILLTVLNLVLIGTFLWRGNFSRPEPPLFRGGDYKDVSGILKQELNLNDSQVEQIQQLRSDFFEKEKVLARAIRAKRDSMNLVMFNKQTDEQLLKRLAREVAEGEYEMELLRIAQAQQLKSICNPEQLEKFEGLVREIRDYFRPDNRPPDRRKENK
jgi:Spy/CpxP family protein refolding chaperone